MKTNDCILLRGEYSLELLCIRQQVLDELARYGYPRDAVESLEILSDGTVRVRFKHPARLAVDPAPPASS